MHTKKILGKYEIIEVLGNDAYYAKIESREFKITRKSKNATTESLQSITFSHTAQKLSSISHPNISNLKVDEDDKYFYFIQERYQETKALDSKVFRDGKGDIDYQRLLQCYMQILSAIGYIHKNGFYHGTINPNNILIDYDNHVFVLDFGRSHFYPLLEDADKRFYAPEQLELLNLDVQTHRDSNVLIDSHNIQSHREDIEIKSEICKGSDIFSFGLCMLKLLLDNFEDIDFEEHYTNPKDLDSLFAKILEDYKLEYSENEIFLLVKQMCLFNPSERISLCDIKEKLERLLDSIMPRKIYEIQCHDTTVDRYCKNNERDMNEYLGFPRNFWEHINDRVKGHKAYIRQVYDEKRDENQLEIALGDLIFVCSTEQNDDEHLFCYKIYENEYIWIEKIIADMESIELRDYFSFTTKGYYNPKRDSIESLKEILHQKFQEAKYRAEKEKLDQQAIATEEALLEAEYKTLQQKKNTQYGSIKEIRKGSDEIVFTLLDKAKIEQDSKASKKTTYIKELETHYKGGLQHLIKHLPDSKIKEQSEDKSAQNTEPKPSHQDSQSQDSKNKNSQNEKNFKPKQKILFRDKDSNSSDSFKGEVAQYNQDTLELTVKREKYSNLNELSKGIIYEISYDYQVEEIIWKKRARALEELQKSSVLIPNLLRKINNPKELAPNALVEIESFFDNLDSNQKEAVQKALSLDFGSEILLIQGPPGTGKTTTITEMLRQIKKRHKHYKILIASQSNQAVDNVLEKIVKENEKILRIGNDESKMSEIARQFTPEKVLNKLIQENRKRIQKNPIRDSNPYIESKLQELQKRFLESLQNLTPTTSSIRDRDYETATLFLKHCTIIFGTLIGISSWQNFRDIVFDFAIIDEAGRATLSELLVPCIKAKKIVLVGDHKQLAPVIDDEVAQNLSQKHSKEEVRASFFERLYERMERDKNEREHIEHFQHRLTHNYRAHKSICAIYSNAFYDGELTTQDLISNQREHKLECFSKSVVWLDTGKMPDKEDTQKGTGKVNHCNARLIERYTRQILNELKAKNLGYCIGIITPYKDQKQLLDSKLSSIKKEFKDFYKKLAEGMGKNNNIKDTHDIKDYALDIGTVDSFQGSDRDIIIYDCVRCSKSKNNNNVKGKKGGQKIDFIADEKRLNVSLSRSKRLLIIIGDMEYLYTAHTSKDENPFEKIIDYIHNHKQNYQIIECK